MERPRIHLVAPAGSCQPFVRALGLKSAGALLPYVQAIVGERFVVTGDEALLGAEEDELCGGRSDDAARARNIETALGDSRIAAMVGVRGGAWFTRILSRIDFGVLERRRGRIAVFGFSELSSLVNIVGVHSAGFGVHDMGPAFLVYGLRRHAQLARGGESAGEADEAWMGEHLAGEVHGYFRDVVQMLDGQPSARVIYARLMQGELDPSRPIHFVGGNLTVFTKLIGTRFQRCIDPEGRWLVLEDLNEKPERIDRMLAQLSLAGFWERCEGVLLGDFHRREADLSAAVSALLPYHLPTDRTVPVLRTRNVGHVWPMSPLPLHHPVMLTPDEKAEGTWVLAPAPVSITGECSASRFVRPGRPGRSARHAAGTRPR